MRGDKPREVIKTALTLQVRDGHLYVFVPPIEQLEAYVALLAALEDIAVATKVRRRRRGLHAAARSRARKC